MAAVPGFKVIQDLLGAAKLGCNPPIEDEDNDNTMWALLEQDPTFTCWTRWKDGRKMIKTRIALDLTFDQGIDAFLRHDDDRSKWDETYTRSKVEKDYVAEGLHDSSVKLDHVSSVGMVLPAPMRWFVRLPSDLKLRITIIKSDPTDNSDNPLYYYVLTSWDLESGDRNMSHKIRKYGEIQVVDGKCCITTVEKSGKWMPDFIVARLLRTKAKNTIKTKVSQYNAFHGRKKSENPA